MPTFDPLRRLAVKLAGLTGLGFLLGTAGCGGGGEEASEETAATATTTDAAPADPCADLSELTADEAALRDSFVYVDRADDPELRCDVCEFWEEPAAGAPCGECQLFPGPVAPGGSCDSFSPI